MTHTPGPWSVEWSEEEFNDGVTVESGDGPVAFRVLECDASLVAAAPEMLALLKNLRDDMTSPLGFGPSLMDTYIDDIKATVARAEGRD
jgi:hypothetical protein